MTSSVGPATDTFRELFCRQHGCSNDAFERQVMGRCFPAYSRPLGRVLLALKPGMFQRELAMVGRLGRATTEAVVRGELDGYAYENQRDKSFRARRLGLRLSRRIFIRVFRQAVEAGRTGGPGRSSAPPPQVSTLTGAPRVE